MNLPCARRTALAMTLGLAVLLLAGCPTIPKNGALLAAELTKGLERNQTETEKIITALAEIQRTILSEGWERIHAQVEKGYRAENKLAADAPLNEVQRAEVAAVAAKTYYDLRAVIAAKEADLKAATRGNTTQLIAINETVQKYLLSVEKLDASRTAITGQLQQLTGIDFSSLNGLAGQLLKNFP